MSKKSLLISFVLGVTAISAEPAPTVEPTPAEVSIRKAQDLIAKNPDHVAYYSGLAMAYARRARESSDTAFYDQAEETLKKSFEIEPGNFEGMKVLTWLTLGRHEFAKARELAAALNKRNPDDVTVYGYLADANAELGNYQEAVDAAQWMLNLRAGNVAGLTRAAYLRELHGDISGSLDLMHMAYDATPFSEAEDRAWLLTQIAHLQYVDGNLPEAEKYAQGALGVFPNYHYALGTLAQVRTAQHRDEEAVELLKTRYTAAPHAENLFPLAEALARLGRQAEAGAAFAEFEKKALVESTIADNANHELMAYYVDDAHQPEKAVKLAEQELLRRHDIFTLDCYAWALDTLGNHEEAKTAIRKALATGVKDPKVLQHANIILSR